MNTVPVPQNARAARSIVFAGIAVLLSALGHGVSAGHGVPVSASIVAFAATSSVAWALADRQRGFFAIGGGLAVMQAVLHVWFGMSSMAAAHGASQTVDPHSDAGMFAAHAAAALVCAVWLWRGELALFALLAALYTRMLAPLLLVLVHPSVDSEPRTVVEVDHRIETLREGVLRHVLARRGPPVGAVRF
ncbi:hypothetical protein ACWEKR_33425 [Nocardia sp. NPDC004573]